MIGKQDAIENVDGSWHLDDRIVSDNDLLAAMGRDKKTRGATLRLVVLEGLARPARLTAPDEELLRAAYDAVC